MADTSDDHEADVTELGLGRMRIWEQLCGALIVAAVALPITPGGESFLALLRGELARGVVYGVLMLAGFGSPFLFGLAAAVAGAASVRTSTAVLLLRIPIICFHAQLVLVAFVLWRHEQGIATLPLLGFAVVGALGYALALRRPNPVLELRRNLEWGAATIAGVAAWCRLQRLVGVELGIAVDVILVAALVLALGARRLPRVKLRPQSD
jgi:hypothetical protein